jgi:hypothetical protein
MELIEAVLLLAIEVSSRRCGKERRALERPATSIV